MNERKKKRCAWIFGIMIVMILDIAMLLGNLNGPRTFFLNFSLVFEIIGFIAGAVALFELVRVYQREDNP